MKKSPSQISPAYGARLQKDYGGKIAETIARGWHFAQLPKQPGEAIAYVRLGNAAKKLQRPLLFVPGFTGGIVANAPFGAALAHRGFDVILPDQHRKGLLRNQHGRHDATYTQAQNIAAILSNEGLEHTTVDVVTHSYGGLVLEELIKETEHSGWTCFKGSKVVMLAPAGIKRPEWYIGFIRRYYQLIHSHQPVKAKNSYFKFADEMFGAGEAFYKANKWRAIREGLAIMCRKVHLRYLLMHGVQTIALLPYHGDKLFGDKVLAKSFKRIREDKVVILRPKSVMKIAGSGHSDQQYVPEPIATAVAQFLGS